MKYINADVLKSNIPNDCYPEEYSIEEIIDEMPSADVRENIHGEWIYICDGLDFYAYECSVCHKDCDAQENLKYNFCPNCGADMRERKKSNGRTVTL